MYVLFCFLFPWGVTVLTYPLLPVALIGCKNKFLQSNIRENELMQRSIHSTTSTKQCEQHLIFF